MEERSLKFDFRSAYFYGTTLSKAPQLSVLMQECIPPCFLSNASPSYPVLVRSAFQPPTVPRSSRSGNARCCRISSTVGT